MRKCAPLGAVRDRSMVTAGQCDRFSAASRMCRSLATSRGSSAGVLHLSLAHNLLAEVAA